MSASTSEAIDVEREFLTNILAPYQETRTAYLRSAKIVSSAFGGETNAPLFAMSGQFSIPSSCYIKDTGHFNAVEFLICFNQLAYCSYGHLFGSGAFRLGSATRLGRTCQELLANISIGQFFTQQLSSMVILRCETRFRRMIDAKDFSGVLTIDRIVHHKGSFFTDTRCVFTDSSGGRAEGAIRLGYLAEAPASGPDASQSLASQPLASQSLASQSLASQTQAPS